MAGRWSLIPNGCLGHGRGTEPIRAIAPEGFVPITQLEHARLGTVTKEMPSLRTRAPSDA